MRGKLLLDRRSSMQLSGSGRGRGHLTAVTPGRCRCTYAVRPRVPNSGVCDPWITGTGVLRSSGCWKAAGLTQPGTSVHGRATRIMGGSHAYSITISVQLAHSNHGYASKSAPTSSITRERMDNIPNGHHCSPRTEGRATVPNSNLPTAKIFAVDTSDRSKHLRSSSPLHAVSRRHLQHWLDCVVHSTKQRSIPTVSPLSLYVAANRTDLPQSLGCTCLGRQVAGPVQNGLAIGRVSFKLKLEIY